MRFFYCWNTHRFDRFWHTFIGSCMSNVRQLFKGCRRDVNTADSALAFYGIFIRGLPPMISTVLFTKIVLFSKLISFQIKGTNSPSLSPVYIIIVAALCALWGVFIIHPCLSFCQRPAVSLCGFLGGPNGGNRIVLYNAVFHGKLKYLGCGAFSIKQCLFRRWLFGARVLCRKV